MEKQTTNYSEWHQPNNEECQHNQDPTTDCTCKRPRTYKPYRVVRVTDSEAPHGISHRLIFHIWPNGLIQMREHGRRKLFSTLAGKFYQRTVESTVRAEKAARKRAKKVGGR
jgi:hypothetical protein